jgi:NDP-sugar pyrophosphorylase family protein
MRQGAKAVLLVGGKGTRLRSVFASGPKPLASVGNRSFLDLLVRQLRHQGIREIVMCTGHMAEQIENEFGDGGGWDVAITYSRECGTLGTAGAIKLAGRYLLDEPDFLVMNGDSFVQIDFQEFIRFHRRNQGLASIAIWEAKNATRYGTVRIGENCRVTGFLEKTGGDSAGLINAGVYVFSPAVLQHIPEGPSSLEKDVFPHLLYDGVYAQQQHGMFIDIGTPEDYARAQALCDRLNDAAVSGKHGLGEPQDKPVRTGSRDRE